MNRLSASGLLAAALAFLVAGCEDAALKTATLPAARSEREWLARHEQFLARGREGGVGALFLGDSITHFWESTGATAWDTLRHLEPANYGISGDRTNHVLWRITAGGELDAIRPAVCVLLIGTNNLTAGQRPEQVAEGIRAVVGELRQRKPDMKVLVMGIFPRSARREDALRARVKETNSLVREFVERDGELYKDIGSKFLAEDGTLSPEVMADYLHLSPKGYAIWAEAIRGDLEALVKRRGPS